MGDPLVFARGLDEAAADRFEGGGDLGAARVDEAAGNQPTAGLERVRQVSGEVLDDVGGQVGGDEIERLAGGDGAFPHFDPILKLILADRLAGGVDGERVDVRRQDGRCAQPGRGGGEDAAARADIKHALAALHMLGALHVLGEQAQAEAGGLVLARPEGEARYEVDDERAALAVGGAHGAVRRADDDRARRRDADDVEVVMPGGAPVAVGQLFHVKRRRSVQQPRRGGAGGGLQLTPLRRRQIGGHLRPLRAVVMPGPGFLDRFGVRVELILDAGGRHARQRPGGDGALDLRGLNGDRDAEQGGRAANWRTLRECGRRRRRRCRRSGWRARPAARRAAQRRRAARWSAWSESRR